MSHAAAPARIRWPILAAYVAVLAIFLSVQAWMSWHWDARFNSDEAILGLAAKHMLEGKDFPVYFYGVRYGGTLPSLLAAPFIGIFGNGVMSLQLSVMALLFAFALLHLTWVRRHFGDAVAVMSLLVLAFPGYNLLSFVSVISTRMSTYLTLAMAAVLLAEATRGPRWLRALLFGLLAGLSFWTQPLTLLYFLAIGTVWVLRSPEWATIREKFPLTERGWAVLFLLCLFGGPSLVFGGISGWLLLPLIVIIFGLYAASSRKNLFATSGALIIGGALIGTAPQWILWLKDGVTISQPYIPSFPDAERLHQIATQILPPLWGVRPLFELPHHILSFRLSSLFIAVLVPLGVGFFLWTKRKILKDVVRLKPLSTETAPTMLVTLFFFLPLIAQLGMDGDQGSVRYLVPTWQASSVIMAILFVYGWRKWKLLGLLLGGLWFFHMAYGNMNFMAKASSNVIHVESEIAELVTYLEKEDSTHGYADFWVAYALDYLSAERLTLEYYDGHVRYAPYADAITKAKRHAYIFLPEWHPIPTTDAKLETMIAGMRDNMKLRGVLPDATFEELRKKRVVSRKKVARWDVWIVENPAAQP